MSWGWDWEEISVELMEMIEEYRDPYSPLGLEAQHLDNYHQELYTDHVSTWDVIL